MPLLIAGPPSGKRTRVEQEREPPPSGEIKRVLEDHHIYNVKFKSLKSCPGKIRKTRGV
jgi:hypothetical protein